MNKEGEGSTCIPRANKGEYALCSLSLVVSLPKLGTQYFGIMKPKLEKKTTRLREHKGPLKLRASCNYIMYSFK